jgi:hypothetical protein
VVLLPVDSQHYGVLAAGIFFGLWLAPMGYLVYNSGWFPKALGVLLIVGCVCYLVDTFAAFLFSSFGESIHHPGGDRGALDGWLSARERCGDADAGAAGDTALCRGMMFTAGLRVPLRRQRFVPLHDGRNSLW